MSFYYMYLTIVSNDSYVLFLSGNTTLVLFYFFVLFFRLSFHYFLFEQNKQEKTADGHEMFFIVFI